MEKKFVYAYIIFVSLLSLIIFPIIFTDLLDDDVFRHISIAKTILSQKDVFLHSPWLIFSQPVNSNYPPLFHWLLVVFSFFGYFSLEKIALLFQIIFYPCCLFTFYKLVSYLENSEERPLISNRASKKIGFISVIILSLYFPFFARTHLAIPEALQHLLIPLVFLFYLKGREKSCGLFLLFLFLNHRFDAFLILFIIGIHWLLFKRKEFSIVKALLIAFPGIFFQLYFNFFSLNSIKTHLSNLINPHTISLILAILSSSILLSIAFWSIIKLRKKIHPLIIIWFFISFVMLFSWRSPRFPAYVAMPAAIIIGAFLCSINIRNKLWPISPIIIGLVLNIFVSACFFPYSHDFYGPGVNKIEKSAYQWIKTNIKEPLFYVGHAHSHKLVYFTGCKLLTTQKEANYLFSTDPGYSPGEEWQLLKNFGEYKDETWWGITQPHEEYKLFKKLDYGPKK